MILGLGAGTGLEVAEEIGLRAAEMVAEDAEGTGGIAESLRDELGRDALHELCAEASHWRWEGEAGSRKKRPSFVNGSGEFSIKHMIDTMFRYVNSHSNVADHRSGPADA